MDSSQSTEWRDIKLGDAMAAIIDYRGKTPRKTLQGIPLITAKIVKAGRILEATEFIAAENYSDWMTRGMPEIGDVVLTSEAPLGEVGRLSTTNVALAQRIFTLRARPDIIDQTFLYYLLQSRDVQQRIQERASGTTVMGIRSVELKEVTLRVPPLFVQRQIVEVLEPLTQRIELNIKLSRILEATLGALFRSWFVDFDPVQAKLEGRTPEGLTRDIEEIFPSELENDVPKGWRVTTLSELVSFTKGRSYTSSELAESDVALVTLKSFYRGGGYRPDGTKAFTGDFKREQVVRPGELIVACTDVTQMADVVGRPAIVEEAHEFKTLVASLDTIILRPRDVAVSPDFLYLRLRQSDYTDWILGYANGTTVLHLDLRGLTAFSFALPPLDDLQRLMAILEPLQNRIRLNNSQNHRLKSICDGLLTPLSSGEFSLPSVEGMSEVTLR